MDYGAVFEVCNGGLEPTFAETIAVAPSLGLYETEAPCHFRNLKESESMETLLSGTQKEWCE